ncbi:MAG: hypothetical protein JO057_12360 [Chloroflexi bacterium]|nr:hypothetical protein [Chloroflexota bacterium]
MQELQPLGMSEGLDLRDLDHTSQAELDTHLFGTWRWRGNLYEMFATSLMTDYAPDVAKLHRWGADIFGRPDPRNMLPNAVLQLYSYIHLGWEPGIFNQFRVLQRLGLRKQQIMEVVMYSKLVAGMRGLGHTYRAVGDSLPDFPDGNGNPPWPEGWAADPDAFKSGLDLTTKELTAQDRINLTAWYERTIGYVPESIAFGMKYDPPYLKMHRATWEVCIKTLPKQVVPYMALRDATLAGNEDALREAALLGRAWGLTPQLVVRSITCTAHYFTGFRGLYTAQHAIGDILDNW